MKKTKNILHVDQYTFEKRYLKRGKYIFILYSLMLLLIKKRNSNSILLMSQVKTNPTYIDQCCKRQKLKTKSNL